VLRALFQKGKWGGLPGTEQRERARCQAQKLGENFPPNYFKPIDSLAQNMLLTEYSTKAIFAA
jgi:hypothetical protein